MTAISRERLWKAGLFAASTVAHIIVLVLIGMNAPGVRRVIIDEEPPVMVVDLYKPPPPPREPQPVRLPEAKTQVPTRVRPREAVETPSPAPPVLPTPVRPREVAPEAPRAPIAPLPMAPVPRPPAPKPAAPAAPPATAPSGTGKPLVDFGVKPGGDVRDALRKSQVGCANKDAVGLTLRERERCLEQLGEGAKDAPYIEAPIGRAKRERFDARAAKKERDRAWREAPIPPGTSSEGAGAGMPAGLGPTEEGTVRPK